MFAEATLDAFALSNTFFHTAGNYVAGSQFLLFGFNVGHEAMAIDVAQQTAVTAAAFRHQNTSREDAGRVELNGFHVAEAGNAAFQGQSVTGAFANLSVGRHAEELAGTARSDSRSLGNVSVGSPVIRSRTTAP